MMLVVSEVSEALFEDVLRSGLVCGVVFVQKVNQIFGLLATY